MISFKLVFLHEIETELEHPDRSPVNLAICEEICKFWLDFTMVVYGIVQNFKRSLAVPNVKYNCAILFWKELYWLFIYASKYFLIDHHCKTFHRIY